jgi:hypothetical protein
MTLISTTLISKLGNSGIIWSECMLVICAALAALLALFVTEDLKRLKEARAK